MTVRMPLGLAFTALTLAILSPEAATAQMADCSGTADRSEPRRKKGIGLGSLMRGGGNGLLGSVMGAVRGEGDIKRDLAGAAASAAMQGGERALACAGQKAAQGADTNPTPAASAGRARATEGEKGPSYPSEIAKPAGFAAIRDAYLEFGKDSCMSCEGGFAYDGWASFPRDEHSSKHNGKAQRIGSWPVGHVHRWQGNISSGTLTVEAEEIVQGFRCRRLTYRLTKGQASAQRPGLLCWGRLNAFAGSDSWVEVY